ncbi:squalene/phytoene synthase family protein, partial [Actinoallomurus acaciae]
DREVLADCRRSRSAEPRVRRALADQIARTREVYDRARPGIALLHPASRPCVATACRLYSQILDRIEAHDYNVFDGRVSVGTGRRLALAGGAVARSLWTRARASEAQ